MAQGIDELAVSSGISGLKASSTDLVPAGPGRRSSAARWGTRLHIPRTPSAQATSRPPFAARGRRSARQSGAHGEETVGNPRLAQVVEDLPDGQPSLAVQPDAARADAAQGHGDRLQVLAPIDPRRRERIGSRAGRRRERLRRRPGPSQLGHGAAPAAPAASFPRKSRRLNVRQRDISATSTTTAALIRHYRLLGVRRLVAAFAEYWSSKGYGAVPLE